MHLKQARAAQAQQTVVALTSGGYLTATGQHVDISAPLAAAVAGTCEYAPDWQPPAPRPRGGRPPSSWWWVSIPWPQPGTCPIRWC